MVNWEEPPASQGVFRKEPLFLEEAAELRANPGKWAVLTTRETGAKASSLATAIKSNAYVAFKEGKWDAVARTVDGEHRVYVRYAG